MIEDEWVRVEEHEDEEAIEDPITFGDFAVTFSDEAAHLHEDLVRRTLILIESFPGVESAVHEDSELIVVWGTDVDKAQLDRAVRDLWSTVKRVAERAKTDEAD